MSDTKYNGWANYATWRVNLEMFDGVSYWDLFGASPRHMDTETCVDSLKDYVVDFILNTTNSGLARDWAMAFLSDVDWREIALHMIPETDDEDES